MSPKYEFVKYILISFVSTFTLIDAFVLHNTNELVIFVLFLLWLIVLSLIKPGKDAFDKIGMGLFALIPILVIFKFFVIAERAAIWLFLYLAVKSFIEYRAYLKSEE